MNKSKPITYCLVNKKTGELVSIFKKLKDAKSFKQKLSYGENLAIEKYYIN